MGWTITILIHSRAFECLNRSMRCLYENPAAHTLRMPIYTVCCYQVLLTGYIYPVIRSHLLREVLRIRVKKHLTFNTWS